MTKSLMEQYQALISQASALAAPYKDGKTAIPAEISTQIDGLLGQADQLKVQIDLMGRLETGEQFLDGSDGLQAAHLGWRKSGPNEGDTPIDPQAWREIKVAIPGVHGEKAIRFQVPLAVQVKGYTSAFEAYLRKGLDFMGPQDRKTLSEGIDSAGGFLTPEDYQTELIKKTAMTAIMRALCRTLTTSRDVVKWPRIAYTTDDKYTSGVRMTWTGETPSSSTVHRVTDPVIGLLSIPVHTAMASLPLSNDLLEDAAFDVAGIGSDLIGEAFGLGEDDVFVNGSGVAQPMGIVTRIAVGDEKVATVNSGSASTLLADGLIDLFFGLPAQYRRNARFVMNSGTAKVARKLRDGGSTGRYLWDAMQANQGSLSTPADQDSLLGAPVRYDEFTPDIAGNAYPILWGDFTGYFIVDRVGLSIQRLSELYAEANVTVLLARKRVGGDVTQPWRLKAQKIST